MSKRGTCLLLLAMTAFLTHGQEQWLLESRAAVATVRGWASDANRLHVPGLAATDLSPWVNGPPHPALDLREISIDAKESEVALPLGRSAAEFPPAEPPDWTRWLLSERIGARNTHRAKGGRPRVGLRGNRRRSKR